MYLLKLFSVYEHIPFFLYSQEIVHIENLKMYKSNRTKLYFVYFVFDFLRK